MSLATDNYFNIFVKILNLKDQCLAQNIIFLFLNMCRSDNRIIKFLYDHQILEIIRNCYKAYFMTSLDMNSLIELSVELCSSSIPLTIEEKLKQINVFITFLKRCSTYPTEDIIQSCLAGIFFLIKFSKPEEIPVLYQNLYDLNFFEILLKINECTSLENKRDILGCASALMQNIIFKFTEDQLIKIFSNYDVLTFLTIISMIDPFLKSSVLECLKLLTTKQNEDINMIILNHQINQNCIVPAIKDPDYSIMNLAFEIVYKMIETKNLRIISLLSQKNNLLYALMEIATEKPNQEIVSKVLKILYYSLKELNSINLDSFEIIKSELFLGNIDKLLKNMNYYKMEDCEIVQEMAKILHYQ